MDRNSSRSSSREVQNSRKGKGKERETSPMSATSSLDTAGSQQWSQSDARSPVGNTLEDDEEIFHVSLEDMNTYIQSAVAQLQPTQRGDAASAKQGKARTEATLDALAFTMPLETKTCVMENLIADRFTDVALRSQAQFDTMVDNILKGSCSSKAFDVLRPILRDAMTYNTNFEIDVFDRHSRSGRASGNENPSIRLPQDMSEFCQLMHYLAVPTQLSISAVEEDPPFVDYPGSLLWIPAAIKLFKDYFGNLRSMTFLLVVTNEEGGGADVFRAGRWWDKGRVTDPEHEPQYFDPSPPLLPGNVKKVVGATIDIVKDHSPIRKNYFKLIMRHGLSDRTVEYCEWHSNDIEINESRTAAEIIDAAMATAHPPKSTKFRNRP